MITLLLCWLAAVASAARLTSSLSVYPNFYAVDYLADGQAERRFLFNGTVAKETSAVLTENGNRLVELCHLTKQ